MGEICRCLSRHTPWGVQRNPVQNLPVPERRVTIDDIALIAEAV